MVSTEPAREFSKIADTLGLPAEGRVFELTPCQSERTAIAKRLDVPAVEALSGRIELRPVQGGVTLTGSVEATLVRLCVVTLEPMTETIDERFELRFARRVQSAEPGDEIVIDEDTPEPLEGDSIDVGEVLVQQLALAMAAYPRREGAILDEAAFGQTLETSPFAVLKGAIAERRDEE